MHNNVRSSARNWYVALAFILLIIALVLAGCAGLRETATRSLGRVSAKAGATLAYCERVGAASPAATVASAEYGSLPFSVLAAIEKFSSRAGPAARRPRGACRHRQE